jgi:hypothetical protein
MTKIEIGSRWGRRDGGSFVAIIENVEELISTDGTTCLDVYYTVYDADGKCAFGNRKMWDKWFLSHYYPLENEK